VPHKDLQLVTGQSHSLKSANHLMNNRITLIEIPLADGYGAADGFRSTYRRRRTQKTRVTAANS